MTGERPNLEYDDAIAIVHGLAVSEDVQRVFSEVREARAAGRVDASKHYFDEIVSDKTIEDRREV
jgi:biotin synthase-like enzyme